MKVSTSPIRAGRAAAFATVAAAATALAACSPAIVARVDAVFADYASPAGPGCSLGVIRDGRLIHATGYGTANLDHGIPNGPATIFRVGSVSKQFTAAAIALLSIRRELDLDAPVRDYIPEFPDYADPPTIRHLVHHRARYAGSFHSPELNAAYRILEEGGTGLTLHAGRLDPATLLADSDGVLTGERGMTFRFSQLVDGRYQAMTVDAGRVRNLRFERAGG